MNGNASINKSILQIFSGREIQREEKKRDKLPKIEENLRKKKETKSRNSFFSDWRTSGPDQGHLNNVLVGLWWKYNDAERCLLLSFSAYL